MAGLPQIPNPTPITIPAVAEVVYDSLYIVQFSIGTDNADGSVQPICCTFRPYSYATQRLYSDNTRDTVRLYPNVWALACQHPLAAQVCGGLIQLLTLEFQLGDIEATVTAAQAPIDAANARLAQIVTALATETNTAVIASLTAEQAVLTDSLVGLQATLATVTAEANAAKAPILAALGVS